ncbi:MAG: SusC/RagA family TonB-linked outer membrane protein, partial [Gemmatimonadota bacterium]
LTGVIETVSPDEFNTGLNISPDQLIQGKVAGVDVYDSGEPGGGIAVRIRGGTSINASNEPLFVVDGMPLSVGGGISAGRNPLNFLNPNDIASMTVLKDASATAIYGSQGANGVVLIETYSGRDAAQGGGSQLTYSGNVSTSTVAGEPEMLNRDQFLRAVQDHAASSMSLLGPASTDWRDVVQQDGFGQQHNVALAGTRGGMDYRLSVGYLSNEGVLRGTSTERLSLGVNYGQNFFDNVLRVTANLKGSHADDEFTPGGVIGGANIYAPTQPVYDTGSPYGGYFEWGGSLTPVNPVAELELVQDDGSTLRSVGDIETSLDIPYVTGLTGTVRVGYDVIKTSREVFRPTYLFGEARQDTLAGFTSHANNTQMNKLLDAFLNYNTSLEPYSTDVDVTAGYAYADSYAEYPYFEADGLEFDYLGTSGIPASRQQRPTNFIDESRLISFFGRANLTFADRYLLTLSLRRDGSSRFGPEEQWGIFPSAAVAWRIADESFMQDFDALSDLKLRASWGVNGNQAFANYQQFSTYTLGDERAQYLFGNTYVPTIRPSAADPGIKWEETTSYNFGVDFGFLQNRFTGSLDYYFKETEDLIFRVPVAAGTNLSNFVTTNIGTMQNQGFEASVEGLIFDDRDGFWWSASFVAATNANELTEINPNAGDDDVDRILTGGIAGGVGNFIQILRAGEPVNSFYVYRHIRGEDGLPVWEDLNGDGNVNEQDLYVDQNGDGLINADDRVPYQSPDPDWTFGHTSSMGYGPFDASFTLRASLGNYVYNNVASNYGHYRALRYVDVPNNLHRSVLETGFEREQYFSDYYVEDASFLRLDNLTLGYTFRPNIMGPTNFRIYGTAQNLVTFTEYRGVDPLAGVNGIDNNLYPRSRTFIVGANVTF